MVYRIVDCLLSAAHRIMSLRGTSLAASFSITNARGTSSSRLCALRGSLCIDEQGSQSRSTAVVILVVIFDEAPAIHINAIALAIDAKQVKSAYILTKASRDSRCHGGFGCGQIRHETYLFTM